MPKRLTFHEAFIKLAERETQRRAEDIKSLWWNCQDGRMNGMVEIDGQRVRIGADEPTLYVCEKCGKAVDNWHGCTQEDGSWYCDACDENFWED